MYKRQLLFYVNIHPTLFYKILNGAILWENDSLIIKKDAYTINDEVNPDPFYKPNKPSILLNSDMYESVTSGEEYKIMSSWRLEQKEDMNFKEGVFKIVTNFACSVS